MIDPTTLRPADFLVTRNPGGEWRNPTLGYWNHAAVYVGDGKVVEAQRKPKAVIVTPIDEFLKRYQHVKVLRWTGERFLPTPPDTKLVVGHIWQESKIDTDKACVEALALVGHGYWRLASLRRFAGMGLENCMTVVRHTCEALTGVDPEWERPDDISRDKRLDEVADSLNGIGG